MASRLSAVLLFAFLAGAVGAAEDEPTLALQRQLGIDCRIAVSPDGALIATGGWAGNLTLWDAAAGLQVARRRVPRWITAIAFSPDGSLVAVGTRIGAMEEGGRIFLVDVRSDGPAVEIGSHPGDVTGLAFRPDGTLASAGFGGEVKLWDVRSRGPARRIAEGLGELWDLAVDPTGERIAVGAEDGRIFVLDGATGSRQFVLGPFAAVHALAYSPDGRTLAAADAEGAVRLFDASTGAPLREIEGQRTWWHLGMPLRFSPDGRRIAAADDGGGVRLFDPETGSLAAACGAPRTAVRDLVFSGNGTRIFGIVEADKARDGEGPPEIRVWDAASGESIGAMGGSVKPGESIRLSPDGRILAFRSDDGRIRLVDLSEARLLATVPANAFPREDYYFTPDGGLLAVASGAGGIRLLDPRTGRLVREVEGLGDFTDAFEYLARDRAGRSFALQSLGTVEIRAADGKLLRTFESGIMRGGIRPLPDGSAFLAWQDDRDENRRLRTPPEIRSAETGEVVRTLGPGLPRILDAAVSADCRRIVTAHERTYEGPSELRVWDVETGGEIRRIATSGTEFSRVRFTPDGRCVLAAMGGPLSAGPSLAVWDVESGERVADRTDHRSPIVGLDSSDDGRVVASVASGGEVLVWRGSGLELLARFAFVGKRGLLVRTPENRLAGSPGASDGAAVRVGNRAVPLETHARALLRPELVLKRLGLASRSLVRAHARLSERRSRREAMSWKGPLSMPRITLVSLPVEETDESALRVAFRAEDPIVPVERVLVSVNGVPVAGGTELRPGSATALRFEALARVELSPGENRIVFRAVNRAGVESLPVVRRVRCGREAVPPDLHVLLLGVSRTTGGLASLRRAAEDAEELGRFFEERTGSYRSVAVRVLANEDVSAAALDGLREALLSTRPRDHVIVFFSGYGLYDAELGLRLAPSDLDPADPAARGILLSSLHGILDGIPARHRLVLLDLRAPGDPSPASRRETDAGEVVTAFPLVAASTIAAPGPETAGALAPHPDLHAAPENHTIGWRSTRDHVVLKEGRSTGLVAHCLLEALRDNRADADGDGGVDTLELRRYLLDRVAALSDGGLEPLDRPECPAPDFRLGLSVRGSPELLVQSGHAGNLRDMAFRPDGRFLATAGENGAVVLWDLRTGRMVRKVRASEGPVRDLEFDHGGRSLVVAGAGRLALLDPETLEPYSKAGRWGAGIRDLAFPARASCFSSDDGLLAVEGDEQVLVLDTRSGRPVARVAAAEGRSVSRARFHPRGRLLAVAMRGEGGNSVRLVDPLSAEVRWERADLPGVPRELDFSHGGEVLAVDVGKGLLLLRTATGATVREFPEGPVACDPEGRFLAVGDPEGGVALLDAASAEKRFRVAEESYPSGLGFSPDGRLLAVRESEAVEVWDLRAQSLLWRLARRTEPVSCLAFDPEGRILAAGSLRDGRIRIWDLAGASLLAGGTDARGGSLLRSYRAGEYSYDVVQSIEFDSSGRKLVAFAGGIVALDLESGTLERRGPGHHPWLSAVAPGGGRLITVRKDPTELAVIDAAAGRRLRDLGPPAGEVSAVVFDRAGERLLAAGEEGWVAAWEVGSGRELFHLPGRPFDVAALALSPDGRRLACPGKEGGIRLFDVPSGRPVGVLRGHADDVWALAFSPRGGELTSGGADGVRIWDLASGSVRASGEDSCYRLCYAPDGRQLIGAHYDGTNHVVLRIDPRDGRRLGVLAPDERQIEDLRPSPDGRLVAVGRRGRLGVFPAGDPDLKPENIARNLALFDLSTGEKVRAFGGFRGGASTVAFLDGGRVLLAAGWGHPARTWDVRTGKELPCPVSGIRAGVLAVSPDGSRSAAGGLTERTVALRDGAIGGQERFLTVAGDGVRRLLFHPGGRLLIAGLTNGYVQCWDAETGEEAFRIAGHDGHVASAAWHPAGRLAATGGSDAVRLWDTETGREVREIGVPPDGDADVTALAFDAEGRWLAGAAGRRVRVWEPETGRLVLELPPGESEVRALRFRPRDPVLAVAAEDGTVTLWDVERGERVATLVAIGEEDFVAVLPDGTYMASRGGLSGLAFRLGGDVYPFEQFDLLLHRPDRVLERLGRAPKLLVEAFRAARKKRLERSGFTEEMLRSEFHLPSAEIVSEPPPPTTSDRELTLRVRAEDTRHRLARLLVHVNDVPAFGSRGIDLRDLGARSVERELRVELSRGRNKVQVSVLNERGVESLRSTVETRRIAPEAPPDVHVLVVGVSDYEGETHDLTYAAKDASDVASWFERGGPRFGRAHVHRLLDGKAVRENILAAGAELARSKVDDLVVVFLSGHGVLDEKLGYWFLTADADPAAPSERGLSYEEIEGLFEGVPARRRLLLMDTCHSGEVDEDLLARAGGREVAGGTVRARATRGLGGIRTSRRLDVRGLSALLQGQFADLRRRTGAMVISSAGGLEYAFESGTWQGGVFTYSLLEGLESDEADTDGDGRVLVSELRRYVMGRVRELTGGAQSPTSRGENLEFDFALR